MSIQQFCPNCPDHEHCAQGGREHYCSYERVALPQQPRTAGEIKVRRDGLTIDGAEFPWHIAVGANVDVNRSEMPSVTVTIFADRVLVDNDSRP